jgi:hypothetical protein
MTEDLSAGDFTLPRQPALDSYYEQEIAVVNDARREGTAVQSRPAFPGALSTITFAEPLAGIRLARARAAAARRVTGDYIRHARQAGHSWHAIGQALGLDDQGDLSDAAVDYAIGPVDSWSRLDASFTWTCLDCDGHIADRGPSGGHPEDEEPGHKPGCERLARMTAEWEAEREA